jgi:hypothetical protein
MESLSISELKCFRGCQRRYYYQYVTLVRPLRESEALRFGSLWHRGMEAWFSFEMDRPFAATLAMTKGQSVLPIEFSQAAVLMEGYELRWGAEKFEPLAVEKEFRAPLVNPCTGRASKTFEIVGKIDAIVNDIGHFVLVEHKTSSQDIGPGTDYWRRLTLDGQISIYFDGAKSLGYDVDWCMYDVVAKPRLRLQHATPESSRKRTRDGRLYKNQRENDETMGEYTFRLRQDIAQNPEKYYQRGTVVRLEEELNAARWDTWVTAKQIHECRSSKWWPRNPDNCVSYGRTCEYFDVCCGVASIHDEEIFRIAEKKHEELAA